METEHDLLIFGVILPGIDGWAVIRSLRRQGNEVPVLFLTAKDQVEDRIKGLELGADDYLVKPFPYAEFNDAEFANACPTETHLPDYIFAISIRPLSITRVSKRACLSTPTKRASLKRLALFRRKCAGLARPVYRQQASSCWQHSAISPQQSLAAKAKADADMSSAPAESLKNGVFIVVSKS